VPFKTPLAAVTSMQSSIQNELKSGKGFLLGSDKLGRAVLLIQVSVVPVRLEDGWSLKLKCFPIS
jgi:hypothetical protein